MSSIFGYIDPNTTYNVFTLFGPILAFFAAGVGVIVSVFLFFRRRLTAWFKKTSRLKLFIVLTVLLSVLTVAAVIVGKFIRHLMH